MPYFWLYRVKVYLKKCHPGTSFAWLIRAHSWSVEKDSMNRYAHLRVRKLCVTLYQRVALHCRALLWPCSPATPHSQWCFCCSECCTPSDLELPKLATPLYAIVCSMLQQISEHMEMRKHIRVPTPRFGRCSAHGCFFTKLRYMFFVLALQTTAVGCEAKLIRTTLLEKCNHTYI